MTGIEEEVKKSIKKVKDSSIKDLKPKKVEKVKEVKKEEIIVQEKEDIQKVVEERPPQDLAARLGGDDLGEQVQQEIQRDHQETYPKEQAYQGAPKQGHEAYHSRPGETGPEAGEFYQKHGQPKDAYEPAKTAHERMDEELNLHKKIQKYIRG